MASAPSREARQQGNEAFLKQARASLGSLEEMRSALPQGQVNPT